MGRLRLDIVNPDMGQHLKVTERLDNGAFGKISVIEDVDGLGRETYVVEKFDGTEVPGDIVFIAHDGHRYDDKKMGMAMAPDGKFHVELNDGFDVVVEAGEMTRGYHLSRRDLISVEPHVLTGEDKCVKISDCDLAKGDLLAPKANSYQLEKTTEKAKAIAKIDGIELWCGYVVYIVRML